LANARASTSASPAAWVVIGVGASARIACSVAKSPSPANGAQPVSAYARLPASMNTSLAGVRCSPLHCSGDSQRAVPVIRPAPRYARWGPAVTVAIGARRRACPAAST